MAAFQSLAFMRSPHISIEFVLLLNFTQVIGRVLYLTQFVAYTAADSRLVFVELEIDLMDMDDFGFCPTDDTPEIIEWEEEFLCKTDMIMVNGHEQLFY